MEQLPPLGRIIPQVLPRTSEIYGLILDKNSKQEILGTARETFTYGSHKRQQLDLYTPSKPAGKEPRPLLIFLYGGGFINGEKVLSRIPGGLVYTNLGYYFAEKVGFDTIIPDYRLNGDGGAFPSGAEDISGVLDWVQKKFAAQQGKPVYLMGNSAGGVHLAGWLLADQFKSSREPSITGESNIKIAGVITLGSLMNFVGAPPPLVSVLREHFGEGYENLSPIALLKKAVKNGALVGKWPRLLVLYSELDPQDIIKSNIEFLEELERSGLAADHFILQGHNHISPPMALGTGIATEEVWGERVVAWCKNSS